MTSARSSSSVSNSLTFRASVVVERRQDLLVNLLQRHVDAARLALRDGDLDRRRCRRAHADELRLELGREPAAAELDGVVAARVVGHDEVEHEQVAGLRGPVVDGREIGRGLLKLVQRLVDELVRHLGLRERNLELLQSGRSGFGCTATVAVNSHGESELLGSA